MKKNHNIYIGVLISTLFGISSCELTPNLDEYKALNALVADEAIVDEHSAELALVGAYSGFGRTYVGCGNPEIQIIPDILSGYAQPPTFLGLLPESSGWSNNDPLAIGGTLALGAYTIMYDLVNRANWIIEQVSKLNDTNFKTPGRRAAILGEAKILRAIGHFNILRLWGQFYDPNSIYGIDVRTSPAKSAQAFPRKTVAESYTAILQDINDGIADAPDLRAKIYVNKTFARGYKAKVLLYKGDYTGAAAAAKEVLDQTNVNFKLAANYASIFDHTSIALFSTSELLFGSGGKGSIDVGMGFAYGGQVASASKSFINAASGFMQVGTQKITFDTNRVSSMFPVNSAYGGYLVNKFQGGTTLGSYEMIYHLRMAEVYLIYAEASARSTKSVSSDALKALNAIRIRAGATSTTGDGFKTYPATISYNQFLEAVRMEKIVELQAEGGESWFDLIRYDYADGFGTGFKVSDTKVTATNQDKFILPIPYESIKAGGDIMKQNPSY
jgi:hypothetical protein